jgi:hypothetical protein
MCCAIQGVLRAACPAMCCCTSFSCSDFDCGCALHCCTVLCWSFCVAMCIAVLMLGWCLGVVFCALLCCRCGCVLACDLQFRACALSEASVASLAMRLRSELAKTKRSKRGKRRPPAFSCSCLAFLFPLAFLCDLFRFVLLRFSMRFLALASKCLSDVQSFFLALSCCFYPELCFSCRIVIGCLQLSRFPFTC